MSTRPASTMIAGLARDGMPGGRGAAGDLVQGTHPERLRACLDARLGLRTIRRLQESQRLRGGLQALIVQRYGELAGRVPDAAEVVACDAGIAEALLDHPNLTEAAYLAGAIWHARALKLLVSGPAVAGLVACIGRRAHACGLRHAALAVETVAIADPSALAVAIERDGFLCLGACFRAAPPALRLRFLLRLPPGTPAEADDFGEAHLRNAPAILARVAAELEEARHAG